MSTSAKKVSRHFAVGSSAGRVFFHRDARTGRIVVDEIVSKTGEVVVKGGPITGGKKHGVLNPRDARNWRPRNSTN